MANTLNNFGLAEKTLKTAGKWCTADIKVKIDSAELENIKPEYIRAGVSIFGTEGTYGIAQESVVIPAGIYEVYFTSEDCLNFGNVVEINYYNCGNYYVAVDLDSRDKCINFWSSYNNGTGGNLGTLEPGLSTKNVGSYNFLNFLVYVPADTELSAADAKKWYKIMHPYVSGKITAKDTIQLKDPSTAAELLIDRETGNYATTKYDFKFRTPYMEQYGGYHTSAGIQVENNYSGNVNSIRYRDETGNGYAYYYLPYYTNNTVDFDYMSVQGGQYIKPDTDQNIDPQVLAWIIVNLKTLNPTGATCKNCGTSTNVSKATNVCDNCDKKYWIGSDVLSTASITYEKVIDFDNTELALYIAKCNDNTIYTTTNRHLTDIAYEPSTSVAINTKYNTIDTIGDIQLTLYTSSIEDVSQVYCASACDYTNNGPIGRDGELMSYTYTAGAPFFLKSNRTFYIKGWSTQIQSFDYQTTNLDLYEIYGDNEVLTCYGGGYWYSDFSVIDDLDNLIGYAGSAECPYRYCAAKFYSTHDDSITNGARTCPACSNTIYFSSQSSDDLQCSTTAPTVYQVFNGYSWYTTDYYDHYGSQTCPNECGATLLFECGIYCENVSTNCPECNASLIANCSNGDNNSGTGFTLAGENPGVTSSKYWWYDNDFEITDDPDPACADSTSCAYACGASFYLPWGAWDGASFGWRVCPQCDQNIYFTFDMTDGYNFQCTKGPSVPSDPSKYYYFDDADLTWYDYWPDEGMNYRYDDCPSCNRNLYMNTSIPTTNTTCPYTDCQASIRISGYTIEAAGAGRHFIDMSKDTSYAVSYGNDDGFDGWKYYKFTAVNSATHYIRSSGSGDMDCYVYESRTSCENNDDNYILGDGEYGGFEYSTYLEYGQTIYLRVKQYTDGETGAFTISTNSTPPSPPQDDTTFTDMSENTSYYVAYFSGTWTYYKFTAPVEGSYYVKSNSTEGDMNCYIFMNKDSCLSGDNSDCICGDSATGDFNYEVYLSSGETIYIKVLQSRDVSDGYFSISRSSVTPPDSGPYSCNNCNTEYSTESECEKCRVRDGCPYFLLCPSCGTYTGYSEAILCESCSGGGENPNPPGDEEGTYCDNHGGYYYGDYCDTCYDRCGYCGQTYYKDYTHYCGCPACNYPEYMQDGGYCPVCSYPDHSYNSCGCVATSSDYYDGDSGHKICGTCGNYADM